VAILPQNPRASAAGRIDFRTLTVYSGLLTMCVESGSMARLGLRLDLDVSALVRLYVEDRLTLAETAARLGCSGITVTRRLIELGIPRRHRGPLLARDHALGTGGGLGRIAWSAGLAYVVGLIAADGNLSSDGRHLTIVSKDIDLLETAQRCLGVRARIRPHLGGFENSCWRLQWGDRVFYDWLLSIGLMPNKSLRLGVVAVPDEWFADFLRGCIDGDGSLTVYTDRYNVRKSDRYVYERLWLSLVSASRPFIEWIACTVLRLRGIRGSLTVKRRDGTSPIWKLKYGKQASIDLIRWMYREPDVPSLVRKRATAHRFLEVLGYAQKRVGRPRAGWLYNEAPEPGSTNDD
jgi:hypothetical protein